MASMQEIIVKITGQDGLSPMLARNATELKNVKRNAASMTSSLRNGFESNSPMMLQARNNVEKYNKSIEAAHKQITGGLTPAMMGIDTTHMQKLTADAERTSQKTSKLKNHVDKLHNSFSGLAGVVSGLIGLGLGAWLKDSVDKAKASKDSWNKLGAVLQEHGGTVKEAKQEIMALADRYGFTAGEVREASRIIMQAGMSYKDLVKDQGALQVAMALSVASSKPVSKSARDLQRAYQGNGRALQVLGLKMDDYKDKTTGVVDKNKLNSALLEKTMGQLEAQGRTYEATTMRYDRSIQRLQISIGEKLLPVLVPFLDNLTLVINKISEAPSYVHYLTAGMIGLVTVTMILAPVVASLNGLWSSLIGLAGPVQSAISRIRSSVVSLTAAETAAAITSNTMFLPIIAGAAAAGIAIYALTSGLRQNAATMQTYNNAIDKGEEHINRLKAGSDSYLKKAHELEAERVRLNAQGVNTTGIERDIATAYSHSKSMAEQAAKAEKALKEARESKTRIESQTTTQETDYADQVKQKMIASGRFNQEQIESFDKQNKSLKEGTALKEYGAAQEQRIYTESLNFIDKINKGKDKNSEAWLKDANAVQEYTTGMDSLAKLEKEYMDADSWTDKAKIWLEQGVTKMQVDWINAMITMGGAWDKFIGTFTSTDAWIKGAWNNTVNWFKAKGAQFIQPFINAYNWIKGAWNNTVNWLKSKWDQYIPPLLSTWNSFVNPLIGTYNWIKSKWNETVSWLGSKWGQYIQPIIAGVRQLDAQFHQTFNSIHGAINTILGPLNAVVKIIYGQSPGILPGFRDMGKLIPEQVNTVMPHLEKLSNAMQLPSVNFTVGDIPSMNTSPPKDLNMSLTGGKGGYKLISNSKGGVSNSHTVYNDHTHYHEPVTINARDMSYHEFKSTLLRALEEGNRRYTPP